MISVPLNWDSWCVVQKGGHLRRTYSVRSMYVAEAV